MNLTIIDGPAGSGKSTRLKDLVANEASEVAWIDARSCTPAAIHKALLGETRQGRTVFCFDDCPPNVIAQLKKLERDDRSALKYVHVFAVRSA